MYTDLLLLHISLVTCSLMLFSARALGSVLSYRWPFQRIVRVANVCIDTSLLLAGVSLWVVGEHHPIHEKWLMVKLLLLVAYISTGTLALKVATSKSSKVVALVASWVIAAQMIATAITKNWLGLFSL